jgi:hypothetical protein
MAWARKTESSDPGDLVVFVILVPGGVVFEDEEDNEDDKTTKTTNAALCVRIRCVL